MVKLETFLPSIEDLNKMDLSEFGDWINQAMFEIPKRRIRRDPLFHLKNEISQLLEDESKSEFEKEEEVFDKIVSYRKYITDQSQLKKPV